MKSELLPSLSSVSAKDWIFTPTLSAGLSIRNRRSTAPLFRRSVTLSVSLTLCRALLMLGALLLGMRLFLWGLRAHWMKKGKRLERKKWKRRNRKKK